MPFVFATGYGERGIPDRHRGRRCCKSPSSRKICAGSWSRSGRPGRPEGVCNKVTTLPDCKRRLWPESRRKTLVFLGPEPSGLVFSSQSEGPPNRGSGWVSSRTLRSLPRGLLPCRRRRRRSPLTLAPACSPSALPRRFPPTNFPPPAWRAARCSPASPPSLTGSPLATSTAPSFASSALLGPNLALDGGQGLDIAGRFTGTATRSPFLSAVTAPYLRLANGGRYTGVTFVPADNLRMRAGRRFQQTSGWTVSISMPARPPGPWR